MAKSFARTLSSAGFPARPLANTSTVSLVLMSPSTVMRLKLWAVASCNAACSGPRAMAASVVMMHNIVAWRKLAEICGEWLKKGSRIYCEGEIITRSYDDKNTGVKKYTTEIVINDMIMLSPKTAGATGGAAPTASAGSAPAASGAAVDDLPF